MAWEENKHPRDEDGKFTSKENEDSGEKDKKKDIKSKVNDYFENYAFNDDADVDEVNAMLEDIEKELPFKNQQEHNKWLDVVSTGTGEEIEEFTKEIANRKMDDDFDSNYDFELLNDTVTDEDIMEEIADGDYYYGGLDEQDIYNLAAKRLSKKYEKDITPDQVKTALKNQGFDYNEYQEYINGDGDFDNDYEEEFGDNQKAKEFEEDDFDLDEDFVENIDNIDYDKADKNELINKSKAKNPNRKDKYGNELVSDEAFKIGAAGVNKYLDFMKQYYDYDKLKQSNIFLEGLQNAASKAIIENGYDSNSDMTYQDFNEIIGSALGDEIDIERNKFTGKKYNGYKPKGL